MICFYSLKSITEYFKVNIQHCRYKLLVITQKLKGKYKKKKPNNVCKNTIHFLKFINIRVLDPKNYLFNLYILSIIFLYFILKFNIKTKFYTLKK